MIINDSRRAIGYIGISRTTRGYSIIFDPPGGGRPETYLLTASGVVSFRDVIVYEALEVVRGPMPSITVRTCGAWEGCYEGS